jgi:hypothetical protein
MKKLMSPDCRLFVIVAAVLALSSPALAKHHHVASTDHGAAAHAPKSASDTGNSTSTSDAALKIDDAKPDTGAKDLAHSEQRSDGRHPQIESNPIDTSITVNQGRHYHRHDRRFLVEKRKLPKTDMTVRTGAAGVTSGPGQKNLRFLAVHDSKPGAPKIHLQRDAVGAVVNHDDHNDNGSHRNAVGAVVERDKRDTSPKLAPGGSVPALSNGPVTQAKLGMPSSANRDHSAAALSLVRMNGLSLSGTGLARPGFNTVAIGGPPQTDRGVLSGNMFHPKHP